MVINNALRYKFTFCEESETNWLNKKYTINDKNKVVNNNNNLWEEIASVFIKFKLNSTSFTKKSDDMLLLLNFSSKKEW